ncbi:NAD(P)/FAD-dependent oxidoreductase [Microbacterium gorillae]|uniref:NAD(P)/FAD-dependent oxidoreductase n=1 Tax=Microbacterium gorillae TaxID=1231063 RepID=UPI00058F3ADB|nr:FAD-dependent oxidoreductase [Microbacterium gorillae]
MTATMERIVVVGNGIAGLTACDTLRDRGFTGDLVVVGSEECAAYSRPALSKALLKPDADLTAHELPASGHGARELLGRSATGLDADRRVVVLDDGEELSYDGLVIASGSRARRLSEHPRELTLRDLADAHAVRDALAGAPDVVVLGGGVLGMEVASGAVAAGCRTTLVATSEPMSRQLGAHVSGLLTASARVQGLEIVVVDGAVVEERDGCPVVVSDTGRVFAADVLISAVGDQPNIEWLAESGLLTDGVLSVDAHGRVRDDIVAAGDVAHWGGLPRLALWTNAIEQAKVAASALLDPDAPELAFQHYFWTEQFGHSVKAVGDLPVYGAPEVISGEAGGTPAVLRWTHPDGSRTAIAIDQRIPIPKLRRLTAPGADGNG